ncbi:hypothetical protein RQP46_006306 [Phenoliferia psychrophenolica]
MGPFAGLSFGDEKETIRRLTVEIVGLREDSSRLQEDRRIAVGARAAAVEKDQFADFFLHIEHQFAEDMERQLNGADTRITELAAQLATRDRELAVIKAEQESFPLSDMDLLHRYQQQSGIFEVRLLAPVLYSSLD